MRKPKIKRPLSVRIARTFLKSLLFLFLFIVFVFLLTLTPPVQRYLTSRAEKYLEKRLETKVDIGRISFDPFGNIKLKGVYVEDRNKDTLLSGAMIKGRVNIFKLFSNKVLIKNLELKDITARIKRAVTDTAFNFQFIVDAFTPKPDPLDTSAATPILADLDKIRLDNVHIIYSDAVDGSDMDIYTGSLNTAFYTSDLNKNTYLIPSITGDSIRATIKQVKPLARPEPLAKDIAEAVSPIPVQLMIADIDLTRVDIRYTNDVSAVYADAHIGKLQSKQKLIDLQQRVIHFDEFNFANSSVTIRMDKKEPAEAVIKEVKQEIIAQQNAGWDIRADKVNIDNDTILYDNNNIARIGYGIDYDHINATALTLHANDLIFNNDSIGGNISKGSVKEQSGFVLNELRGNILYANKEAYAKDVFIKTPGTEIKRSASLVYASREELADHFERTIMNADINESYVQVKDILFFAPSLRKQKAFSNPNDIWQIDLAGNGTFDRLVIDNLRFDGLYNTQINARGTLTGLSNTKQAGGNFTINNLHTTQTDISLLTGKRLSNENINIPEDIRMNGTIAGNAGTIATRMNISTSSGAVNVNGRFSNLADPNNLIYDAAINTSSLNIGSILKQPETLGMISGSFTVKGKGTAKENATIDFTGHIISADYNKYRYSNVIVDGSVANSNYNIHADINDPNAAADLIVKGNFSGNSFTINGMIDSLKTLPLHLTAGPLIARGKIEGTVSDLDAGNPGADILISKGLFVSGKYRLPLDTIQIKSGRNDSANYLTLQSDIANVQLTGEYRLAELGDIFQNSMQSYLPALQTAGSTRTVHPYNFRFNISARYSPIYTSFVPALKSFDDLSAEGTLATGLGINATVRIPSLVYNGNEFSQLYITAAPSDSGLLVNATARSIKSGSTMALYNTRLNAIASGNDIRFTAATDDQQGKNKYRAAGLFTVISDGNYAVSLNPDNLILNYETWNVAAGNRINITPNAITATNFVLQKDDQRLSINNADLTAGSLDVQFTQFRLATITGFVKTDSLPADGLINGNLVVSNILQTPSFTGHLTVNDLSMQKDTIGNLDIQVTAVAGNRHNTTATITGRGNDITMTGYFIPGKNDIVTDLDVNIRKLQLATMEGALSKVLSSASGSINGIVKIKGNLSDPQITGEMGFQDASFISSLLGSRFKIGDQKLNITQNGIQFRNFIVRDSAGNQLEVNGRAVTTNFTHYDFDVSINARNFQVLDRKKAPGQIYYGKLNVTADLRIRGTELKPSADGTITVNQGTELTFVIPQEDAGVAQRNGIVEFVDMDSPENDSLFLAYDSLNQSGILGFDVTTSIEIKKEAIFNIVVDESNGDFLNVQGEAQLSAGIDPSGKITLAGNYILEQGAYQISFNFLRRKFDIQRGSNIVWAGEPTTATLDIKAVYVSNTAPLDLVSSQLAVDVNRNIYLQKLPFEVHLDITGELMKPTIDFDIMLPEKNYGVSNDIVTAVQSRLSLIRQDEGEINKQVFSLLLLNRFVGDNPFQSGSDAFSFNSYARQSVSKLLTEQLNQLAAGLIGGIDIDFDVVSTDDYTTGNRMNRTDLNIGLSKRLLSNRLKITVGSNFQLEGPQNSNQQNNNIVGNIAADYQLSRDGRYMIRFYRQNEYQGIVDGYIIETGVSFILSVDYERFMQIFRKRKKPQAAPAKNGTGI